MSKITGVKARLFKVPLDEVLVDAKHGAHSHFHLITYCHLSHPLNIVIYVKQLSHPDTCIYLLHLELAPF